VDCPTVLKFNTLVHRGSRQNSLLVKSKVANDAKTGHI